MHRGGKGLHRGELPARVRGVGGQRPVLQGEKKGHREGRAKDREEKGREEGSRQRGKGATVRIPLPGDVAEGST